MVSGRVSILVPSRNERFLVPTVQDVLAKARGDIEIIVILDGYWEHGLPADPRLRILHKGAAEGMRPAINDAARIATGQYLLKADAHVLVDEGFDEKLKADYHEDNWILIPRRYPLDPENWCIEANHDRRYPVDYEYLSYPFERPDDPACGLHGTKWPGRREARKDVLLDDNMSFQGSFWFMSRLQWTRIGDMDIKTHGSFIHEAQELGLKTQLMGGSVKVSKRTYYAHLFKGKKYGRGYSLGPSGHANGTKYITDYWMNDRFPKATRKLRDLIQGFAPVPGWPSDWADVERATRDWTAMYQRAA